MKPTYFNYKFVFTPSLNLICLKTLNRRDVEWIFFIRIFTNISQHRKAKIERMARFGR